MADQAYQRGIADLLDGTKDFLTDTFVHVLIGTATAYTPNKDDTLFDAGGANDIVDAELTGVAGYARGWGNSGRKALTSKTVSVNNTNDRVELDCADPSWTGLGTGDTVAADVIGYEGASADTGSRPVIYLDLVDTPTNGSDLSVQMAANGFCHFNC